MKNQNINNTNVNEKANFIDLKNAKNPLCQPMAGKTVLNIENKTTSPENTKSAENIAKDKAENITEAEATKETPQTIAVKVEKPALNLEGTLKLVEELHRRMVQRGRLVYTIENLDRFEIEQKEEAEDTLSNYYQGCELEITDDKRNKFSTKNPVIIKAVALFVRNLCTDRLAEIEAEITIPA